MFGRERLEDSIVVGRAAGYGAGEMPVRVRVVDSQLQLLFGARLRKLCQDVFAVGGRVDDVEVGIVRLEHAEPIVVLGRNHDVRHAGLLCQARDTAGIESDGVELRCQCGIFILRDGGMTLDLFAQSLDALTLPDACRNRVDPPVDEEAEGGLAPRLQRCVVGAFVFWG